jgi:hypothetical protein
MRVNLKKIFPILVIISGISLNIDAQEPLLPKNTQTEAKRQKTIIESQVEADFSVKEVNQNESVPDTNFTYEKYGEFLKKVSDTTKYLTLPIDEFRNTFDANKIIIGLRHDVDNDLNKAVEFSQTEKQLGKRSTYYILHTAPYYLARPDNMAIHTDAIIPVLKDMQDNSKFEIGFHNDLVTLQAVYNIDPVNFLTNELNWLRSNGLRIKGTASHGSSYCKVYWYLNYYFFNECTWPVVSPYVNNLYLPIGSSNVPMKKGNLSDFGLEYEAYFLNNNKYFSDASFVNGSRWHIGLLDLNSLSKGDRVIILLHPIHWHKGSELADFILFSIPGQRSSTGNTQLATIKVVLPYGISKTNLKPTFYLSPGAYSKVNGKMQESSVSVQDFTQPVTYTVYAEDRAITKDWIISVENEKNSACDFKSFAIPGYSRKVKIDYAQKSILAKVYRTTNIHSITPAFTLSEGATAWIGSSLQSSNSGTVDFSSPVTYKVIAEDGKSTSNWKTSVEFLNHEADILSFEIPGLAKPAVIDTINREVVLVVNDGASLKELPALFTISPDAKAYVQGLEQISGLSLNNYDEPVIYRIVSEDSLTFKSWQISASRQILSDINPVEEATTLRIYPNPVFYRATIELKNLKEAESKIEIYNTLGVKVYSKVINNVTSFTEEIDISGYLPGIYFVKCSSVRNPVTFIVAGRKP